MANTCDTAVAFYSSDGSEDLVLEARNTLIKIHNKYAKSQYDCVWIGDFFNELGIEATDYMRTGVLHVSDMTSFGSLRTAELERPDWVRADCFVIEAEEAWDPNIEIWNRLADKLGLGYVLKSVEPGCEVFVNTDYEGKFFDSEYYLETDDGNVYETCDEPELLKLFNELYETNCESYEQCRAEARRIANEEYICLGRFD